MAFVQFLGASGTVTGSKYLVGSGNVHFLVDCGMFQGAKQLRLLNWAPPAVPPASIDHILLTHAHIDHAGMIPLWVRQGFQGSVWSTPATRELSEISLTDAGHLQEEDARFANKKGFSKHKPALPLYTVQDAERALQQFRSLEYDKELELGDGTRVRFRDAGHILGSSIAEVSLTDRGKPMRILFSGDLGRYNALILRDPAPPLASPDYLIVESTYGSRTHPAEETAHDLAEVVNETAKRGGMLIIPAFTIGRTQTLLYVLRELKEKQAIPDLPIFIDSPMAVHVTEVFCRHISDFDEEAQAVYRSSGKCPILAPNLQFVRTQAESQELNDLRYPGIVLSASGMATGGRILHHLKLRLPESRNTVLFVGYQSVGTRGQLLKDGAKEIKIHGEMIPVRAQIRSMESFSGHADSNEILRWLKTFKQPPKLTFIVHGESGASQALEGRIKSELGWDTRIPEYLEAVKLRV
jgi:metallo-beta-lactamase family protein